MNLILWHFSRSDSINIFNQAHDIGGDALLTAGEAEAFGSGGLDGHISLGDAHHASQHTLHGGDVGIELGLLGTDSGIDVSDAIALFMQQGDSSFKEDGAANILIFVRCVGKVVADIA